MNSDPTLDALWESAPSGGRPFRPEQGAEVLEPARRYLRHAIAPGTPLASAVRLRMHGELKLGRWFPFEGEQVIVRERGMIWRATVRAFGLPIQGFDRVLEGKGAQKWRLFGWIPLVSASGPDVSRSTAERMAAEFVWLPSVLCRPGAHWSINDNGTPTVELVVQGHTSTIEVRVDEKGAVQSTAMMRWGEADDGSFQSRPFGAVVEAERTFDGYTIPSELRVGWHVNTDRFASEGEFFRGIIDEATFR